MINVRKLISVFSEPMVICLVDGTIIAANKAAMNACTTDRKLVGKSINDCLDDAHSEFQNYLQSCAKCDKFLPGSCKIAHEEYRVEGARFQVEADRDVLVLLRFVPKNENIQRFALLTQKLAELSDEVKANNEEEACVDLQSNLFKRLFYSNVVGIFVANYDGRIIDANDSFLEIVGYSEGDLTSGAVFWTDLTPTEYLHVDSYAIQQCVKVGQCEPYKKEYLRKDGSRTSVYIAYANVSTKRDEVVGVAVSLSDVPRMEEEILAGEARFRTMIERSKDGLAIIEIDNTIRYATPPTYTSFGYSLKQFIGYKAGSFIHLDDKARYIKEFRAIVASPGKSATHEYRVRHADGSYRWNEITRSNHLGDPYVEGIVVNYHDIQARKFLEDQLINKVTQLAHLNKRKDEFLAMLGHELRNPLAAMSNARTTLSMPNRTPEMEVMAMDILGNQIEHVNHLVDDIITVTRALMGKLELRIERVLASDIVERGVQLAEPLIESMGHKLTIEMPKGIFVNVDKIRIVQVVANLLSNAAKYTYDCGDISLICGEENGSLVIKVKDNGIGINKEDLEEIFDLCVRTNIAVHKENGLGVGLTMVKTIVELHGGTVEAISDGPGKGSEFIVSMPVITTEVNPSESSLS